MILALRQPPQSSTKKLPLGDPLVSEVVDQYMAYYSDMDIERFFAEWYELQGKTPEELELLWERRGIRSERAKLLSELLKVSFKTVDGNWGARFERMPEHYMEQLRYKLAVRRLLRDLAETGSLPTLLDGIY